MGYYILDTQILVLGSENIEQELLKRIDTLTGNELFDIANKWQRTSNNPGFAASFI